MAGTVKSDVNILQQDQSTPTTIAIQFQWTGDASNGLVPAFVNAIPSIQGFTAVNAIISAGPLAPTVGYSVAVLDAAGIDILGGAGVSIIDAAISITLGASVPPIYGGLTLQVSGNAVASAKGRVVVFFRRVSLVQMMTPAVATLSSSASSLSSGLGVISSNYNFAAQTPQKSLTGAVAAVVTMAPMPTGINASSPNEHYLRITDTSTALSETVLITARNSTTITFTPANSHTAGNWTIKSATQGIQEATFANVGDTILIPSGTILIYQRTRVPRQMTFQGQGADSTILQFQSRTIDGFVSATFRVSYQGLRFKPILSTLWQTAGACIRVTGAGNIISVFDCASESIYDFLNCNWGNGFLYIDGLRCEATVNNVVYHAATAASGFQWNKISADGRYQSSPELLSPCLFYLKGSIAGITFTNFFLQAATWHFNIESTDAVGTNEMVMGPGILDQDTPSSGAVRMFKTAGNYQTSSNSMRWQGVYVNTDGKAFSAENVRGVVVQGCYINMRGLDAPLDCSVNGEDHTFNDNIVNLTNFGSPATAMVKFSGTVQARGQVNRNKVYCYAGSVAGLVNITATTMARCYVKDNQMDGILALVTGTPTAGAVVAKDNFWETYSGATSVVVGATITLPSTDESVIVIVVGAGTITRILGGYSNRRVVLQTQGIVNLNTGGANPGNIGRTVATVADKLQELQYEVVTGLWYPVG